MTPRTSTMISKEEVKHIAKLARLGMADADIERFQKNLSSILEYFDKLKEVDVSNTAPTSQPFEIDNVLRKDAENPVFADMSGRKKMLEQSPETKENYIKVKSILK